MLGTVVSTLHAMTHLNIKKKKSYEIPFSSLFAKKVRYREGKPLVQNHTIFNISLSYEVLNRSSILFISLSTLPPSQYLECGMHWVIFVSVVLFLTKKLRTFNISLKRYHVVTRVSHFLHHLPPPLTSHPMPGKWKRVTQNWVSQVTAIWLNRVCNWKLSSDANNYKMHNCMDRNFEFSFSF